MERLFYELITPLGDAFSTGLGNLRPAVVSGPTKVEEKSIGVVSASAGSVPATANDVQVVVVEPAASGAVE